MKHRDHKMHENCIGCLAQLVSPCVYNSTLIKDASLDTQFHDGMKNYIHNQNTIQITIKS